MKTIKREAKVGERILIVNANSPLGTFINGDIFTVVVSEEIGVDVSGHGTHIFHDEYEVIVEAIDVIEACEKLREDLTKAVEELRQLALGVRNGISEVKPTPPTAGEIAKHCREVAQTHIQQMTPQQQRDAIVETAKEDISRLANRYGYYYANGGNTEAEFIVNADKHTVVVILRWITDGQLKSKGIAKCAPTDCFNAHIGKAIALRRALGLEVPAGFLNAPQPTDVRVGDVVQAYRYGHKRFKHTVSGGELRAVQSDVDSADGNRNFYASIIDDTREGVDGK